jgi:ATP-binding cassette subfamily B protein
MRGTKVAPATAKAVVLAYLRIVARHPWLVSMALGGVIGMQIAALVTPIFLRSLFNLLAEGPATEIEPLFYTMAFVAGGWFAFWVFNRFEHFVNLYLITRGMSDAVSEAYRHLLGHSYHFFISNFAGSLTHKINKYAKAFQVIYEAFVLTFLPALLFVIGSVTVLAFYNVTLGGILAVWVIIFILFQVWSSNMRQPYRRVRAELDTKITATLADTISNQNTISLFSNAKHEIANFSDIAERWRKAGVRSWGLDAIAWSVTDLFMVAIQVVLLYGAIIFWSRDLLTLGDFVLIQTYLIVIFGRLTSIQHDLKRVFDALAEGGEMIEILRTPHGVSDKSEARALKPTEGQILFNSVGFGFYGDLLLENLNLTISGGEKVALVGPSGAGKTTVTKLLLRLYDVKSGSIEIDGQNIAEVTQDSLREAIAFVPQEPILFHRTLMENIRYGRRDATDEEVYEAARKAHCHEFISKLPLRYDTYVGERGVKLSGGERQRVAIARALLKNAPILVLDEATSSLDSESEAFIQDALETLMRGKTVIVIAHRLSTIMKMDRIVVMQEGSVVADGTHQELLAQNGLYKKLWSIQAGGFLADGAPHETAQDLPENLAFIETLADDPEEK